MQFVASGMRSPAVTALTSALSAIVAILRRVRKLSTALRHRREAIRLLAVSDDMLRDIGITRFEVASALASPLHCDPTADLAAFAAERRAAARAARARSARRS
jgi:uncharacterized protein YjiS (DUF1127 family)